MTFKDLQFNFSFPPFLHHHHHQSLFFYKFSFFIFVIFLFLSTSVSCCFPFFCLPSVSSLFLFLSFSPLQVSKAESSSPCSCSSSCSCSPGSGARRPGVRSRKRAAGSGRQAAQTLLLRRSKVHLQNFHHLHTNQASTPQTLQTAKPRPHLVVNLVVRMHLQALQLVEASCILDEPGHTIRSVFLRVLLSDLEISKK